MHSGVLLQKTQRASGKDRGDTILQIAATGAPAVNKDEETREDTQPLTVRNETAEGGMKGE